MNQQIADLKELADSGLLEHSEGFARSLISQYEKKGTLSGNQWFYVSKLLRPKPEAVGLGSLSSLMNMFKSAKQHLKFPKFRIVVNGVNLGFSLAKEGGKNPGYLYVKRDQIYIGKISPEFKFIRGADCQNEDVVSLQLFAKDPESAAAAHGKLTARCCFCNQPLDSDESLAVGYGPVCSKRYNLKWGKI